MSNFGPELIEQVPALVVLALVIVFVLKHVGGLVKDFNKSTAVRDEAFTKAMSDRDEAFTKYMESRDKTIAAVAEQCHDVQKESIKAVNENSAALGRMTEAIHNFDKAQSRV